MLMRCRFGLSVWSKKIFAQGKIKWKKIYARQLTLKKYSCYGLKKFKQGIWWQKKFLRLENSPPPPITFRMVRPLGHKRGSDCARRSQRRLWKLGLRIVPWSKSRMFCEESLRKIKFRAFRKVSVHEFCRLKALITLEQVNITEWSKTIIIIRLPNISGINRNFFVLGAMSQMFGWQYNTIQHNSIKCKAMQCNAVQYNTIKML